MKQFFLGLLVAGFLLFTLSCQHRQQKSESVLYRDFDLDAIVKQTNVPELQMTTASSSVTTSYGETTERRRNYVVEYRINELDGKRFDEIKFFKILQLEISQKIGLAGIQKYGGGFGDGNFYFGYSKDEIKGSVEVVGARLEGNRYKLWCVVRETAGTEKSN